MDFVFNLNELYSTQYSHLMYTLSSMEILNIIQNYIGLSFVKFEVIRPFLSLNIA